MKRTVLSGIALAIVALIAVSTVGHVHAATPTVPAGNSAGVEPF